MTQFSILNIYRMKKRSANIFFGVRIELKHHDDQFYVAHKVEKSIILNMIYHENINVKDTHTVTYDNFPKPRFRTNCFLMGMYYICVEYILL
jgi:hypothetical protein